MSFHALVFAGYGAVPTYTKPIGAHIIASTLRQMGLTAVVLDYALVNPLELTKLLLAKFGGPDTRFVCVSTTLMSRDTKWVPDALNSYSTLIRLIRKTLPEAKIVIGGSDIASFSNPVDYVVKGQGEQALRAIVNHELFGDSLVHEVLDTGARQVTDKVYGVSTFNTDSSLVYDKHYDCVGHRQALPIEFGRGCVFRCSYCSYDLLGKDASDFTKSEETLYRSIMSVHDAFGTEAFVLVDDTINDSLEKALTLQRVVRRLPFKFQFGGYMRLELFHKHPEMADIYAECGLRSPSFGIETFNKASGQTVGKGFGEKAKDVLDFLLDKWGLETSISLNFIVGLPHDSRDLIEKQHDWLLSRPTLGYVYYAALMLTKHDYDGFLSGNLKSYYDIRGRLPEASYAFDWKTEHFTRPEASKLANELNSSYDKSRSRLANRMGSFALVSALGDYSWEYMMTPGVQPNLAKFYENAGSYRYRSYLERLDKIVPPSTPLPQKTHSVVANTGVFESKIKLSHIANRGKISILKT